MKNLNFYFDKALKKGFALGAFNFNNMEVLQAIVSASENLSSPCIISVSEGAMQYMGEFLMPLANTARKNKGIFLHLDHGKSYEVCKKAVELGFDSVMIDGSALPFDENVKLTKKVVNFAHKRDVLVEGELGQLKGIEESTVSDAHHFTDPEKAKEFVTKTGVDTLAIAIGTSHGAYKYQGEQTLRFDILSEIERLLANFPLVLHGASTVEQSLLEEINANGGKLENAVGIPKELIIKAIKEHNIVKINTDTDLRLALTSGTRAVLNNNSKEFDPRKYLGAGRERVQKVVEDKMANLLFSKGQK